MREWLSLSLMVSLWVTNPCFANTESQALIESRIAPVGHVSIATSVTTQSDTPKTRAAQAPPPRQPSNTPALTHIHEIYKMHCAVCHASGLAGSPRFGVKRDWQRRLRQIAKTTQRPAIEVILANAIRGVRAMPAKGNCHECSNKELKALIYYMMSNGKRITENPSIQ